jgi:hypothetical protein
MWMIYMKVKKVSRAAEAVVGGMVVRLFPATAISTIDHLPPN